MSYSSYVPRSIRTINDENKACPLGNTREKERWSETQISMYVNIVRAEKKHTFILVTEWLECLPLEAGSSRARNNLIYKINFSYKII